MTNLTKRNGILFFGFTLVYCTEVLVWLTLAGVVADFDPIFVAKKKKENLELKIVERQSANQFESIPELVRDLRKRKNVSYPKLGIYMLIP